MLVGVQPYMMIVKLWVMFVTKLCMLNMSIRFAVS